MGGPTNHPIGDGDPSAWFRQQEKRTLREERRPRVTAASDILGPGFAPRAVQVNDWNAEEATFNGFFYSEAGAIHTPGAGVWIGLVIATPTGHGLQQVWSHAVGGDTPPTRWTRSFHTHTGETTTYSAWSSG